MVFLTELYAINNAIISFKGSIAVTQSWYSEYSNPTFLTGLECNGTEGDIFHCQRDENAPVCSTSSANVICPGINRL